MPTHPFGLKILAVALIVLAISLVGGAKVIPDIVTGILLIIGGIAVLFNW